MNNTAPATLGESAEKRRVSTTRASITSSYGVGSSAAAGHRRSSSKARKSVPGQEQEQHRVSADADAGRSSTRGGSTALPPIEVVNTSSNSVHLNTTNSDAGKARKPSKSGKAKGKKKASTTGTADATAAAPTDSGDSKKRGSKGKKPAAAAATDASVKSSASQSSKGTAKRKSSAKKASVSESGSVSSKKKRKSSAKASKMTDKDNNTTVTSEKSTGTSPRNGKKTSVAASGSTRGSVASRRKSSVKPLSRRPSAPTRGSRAGVRKSTTFAGDESPSLTSPSPSRTRRATATGGRGSQASSPNTRGGSNASALAITVELERLLEAEAPERNAIEVEEELARESNLYPVYHLVVVHLVQSVISGLDRRQAAMAASLQEVQQGSLPALAREAQLREEVGETRALQQQLAASQMECEKRAAELEVLRTQLARESARAEVARQEERDRVQAALTTTTIDLQTMKQQLARRIDAACSAVRTPQYESQLRSLQEVAAAAQAEVQAHHDALTKLILSIGARETFARDGEGVSSMHSNFPVAYRQSLRRLSKDQLINVLDALSFTEGVVEIVGRAVYVLDAGEYKTQIVSDI